MSEIDPKEFGALQAQVELMKETLAEIRTDVKTMKADWDKTKGGSKVFFAMSAIAGSMVTTVVGWFLKAKGYI